MIALTICLVTRGREEYIKSCLESLKNLKELKLANILIIDNGSTENIRRQLIDWSEDNSTDLIRFETNDTRANRVWECLREKGVNWVLFPGDDDVVVVDGVKAFHEILKKKDDLAAVSFNLREMNQNGTSSATESHPAFVETDSVEEQVAAAFHQPPFFWPSLFVNINAIPNILPTSRYVFDWWIGLQLLLTGKVISVDQAVVNYRNHLQQESNLANLRRKYFEAAYWLTSFTDSSEFKKWFFSLSVNQAEVFWTRFTLSTPIYGDEVAGFAVQLKIAMLILLDEKFSAIHEKVALGLASSNHVLMKSGDVKNLLSSYYAPTSTSANITMVAIDGVCDNTKLGQNYLHSNLTLEATISCLHSKIQESELIVDCSSFSNLDPDQVADAILFQYIEKLENEGTLRLLLTQNERRLLRIYRIIQRKLPRRLKSSLKTLLTMQPR